jgi:ribosomal protein S18 acetylase RimI-like enzyme
MPRGRFWYLHIAGCDPAAQGKGLGGGAIRTGLDRFGRTEDCYLETATEGNIGIYNRLGFEVIDTWTVSGGGPRFWSMLRPAG